MKKLTKTTPRFGYFLFLLAVSLLPCGCFRYSFTGSVPTHLHTIAVPQLDDRTAEFGLRENLTDALISAFRTDNTLRPVDEQRADAVLTGTIASITETPQTYTTDQQVIDFKVTINVNFKFYDKIENKTLFEGPMSAWATYNYANTHAEGRQAAVNAAVQKLATDVVTKTLSGW